jgi:hypothetical protein
VDEKQFRLLFVVENRFYEACQIAITSCRSNGTDVLTIMSVVCHKVSIMYEQYKTFNLKD